MHAVFFFSGFWNSEEGFWYSELWLWLIFPHLPWLWWTALHLISWSAATNIRVISQPHPAKYCTALHFIFLQQQWCISLLHMFSLTALICHSLVPAGMCVYMHCISCSRKCQCLAHGHKLEFDVPPVKCFVLLPLSGGVCAHLMCKPGLCCSAIMILMKPIWALPALGRKSSVYLSLGGTVFHDKPYWHGIIKLLSVYWLLIAISSVSGSQEPVTEQFHFYLSSFWWVSCLFQKICFHWALKNYSTSKFALPF